MLSNEVFVFFSDDSKMKCVLSSPQMRAKSGSYCLKICIVLLGGGPVVEDAGDRGREWDAGLVESQPDTISGVLEAAFHGTD